MTNAIDEAIEKMGYVLSVLICADVKGANASLQHAKEETKEALASLTAYKERLESEDLVEEVADAICDESLETCNEEYSCLLEGKGQSMMDVGRLLAQAAIKTIKGEL